MKSIHRFTRTVVSALIFLFFVLAGCTTDNTTAPPPPPPINTGSANFQRYVALGNSITAGYQSNALSRRDQVFAYPNLLAKHLGVGFESPLMRDPGIPGRIRLASLSPPTLVSEPPVIENLNQSLPRPYNNLGIPGALLFDMFDTTDFMAKAGPPRLNPFFALILRSAALGNSMVAQARALQPTFLTLWIGANDVLGYATSGGTRGSNAGLAAPPRTRPTETMLFEMWYRQVIDSLRATGAGIVVANIPDVTSIPFLTTLASQIRPGILRAGAPLRYQRTGNTGIALDTTTLSGAPTDPLILLSGSSYALLLGQSTGRWYRDNNIAPGPGIDTTLPFGFHPQNPWPDALTLDSDELAIAQGAVNAFNAIIDSIATNRDIGVVDANGLLRRARTEGIYHPSFGTFSTTFITGGLFSYDGVHPSSRAHAIIANEFIKMVNQRFGASIPPVALNSVPGIPIGKTVASSEHADVTSVDWKSLEHLLSGE